jgi:hypothetical protein
MSNRPNIPFSSPGVVIITLAFAPAIIKRCRPAVKIIGQAIEKVGVGVQKIADASANH